MHFIATVKYKKPAENGQPGDERSVQEKYLVNAVSVTEAEVRIIKWKPSNYKELDCKSVGIIELDAIISDELEENGYYIGRVKYSVEGKKGKIKWRSFQALVNGKDIKDALSKLEKYYETSSVDMKVASISESRIIVDSSLTSDNPVKVE